MLSEQELDRVCVVLVRARNPGNIGAVARAMRDFGFRHLRVVNEFPVPFEAARSAVDASEVLAEAMICGCVAEAVADCTLVVGTTAVGERDLQHKLLPVVEAGAVMRAEVMEDGRRVALLFGSEKTGLSNEELSHCHWLLTVPMNENGGERHLSMNLGQAVAVCLYELARAPEATSPIPVGKESNVPAGTTERLTQLLHETLDASEYTRHHPANCDSAQVRRLVLRMGADAKDAPVWLGILRQVLWKLRGQTYPDRR
jgi:TrmH family RNA methyltransferase